tara:strand:- start:122 stop:691 length:570 start_codon:yes stop_codon:yes gene_type:complete
MANLAFVIKRTEEIFMECSHKEVVAVFRNEQQFESLYSFYEKIKQFLPDYMDYYFDVVNLENADKSKLLLLEENTSDWNFSYTGTEVYPYNQESHKEVEKEAKKLQKEDSEKNVNIEEVLIKNTLTRKEIIEVFFENYEQDIEKYEFLKFLMRSLNSGEIYKKESAFKYRNAGINYKEILENSEQLKVY